MNRDPFGFRQMLMEFAVAVLVVAFCLHWAVILIEQVWPWLLGFFVTSMLGTIAWRVWWYRSGRW